MKIPSSLSTQEYIVREGYQMLKKNECQNIRYDFAMISQVTNCTQIILLDKKYCN